jgi:ABC-type tungstate transport system permease subunit
MNAHENFYSFVLVNQPEKIITVNTKQAKYFWSVPQEKNTGGKIDGNIYVHC